METTATDRPALDSLQLRAAFGQFPTGVTVITTCAADGRKVGLTAKQLADDADENAKAPVTIGTRTWL